MGPPGVGGNAAPVATVYVFEEPTPWTSPTVPKPTRP